MDIQTDSQKIPGYAVPRMDWAARRAEIYVDVKIAFVTTPIFMIGQEIQKYPAEFPQFLRWHLTNMVDVPAIAMPVGAAAIAITGRSHPKKSAAFVLSLGVSYKVWESYQPHHSFDYTDVSCFVGGAIAYVAARKWLAGKMHKKRLQNNEGPK